MRILTEASGSLTSAYIIKAIKEASHVAVASDISSDVASHFLADGFILMPSKNDPNLWDKVLKILIDEKVDMVIPSLDEMLLGWSQRKKEFFQHGIKIIISKKETIQIFQDKWLTYKFFKKNGIPTPQTSLKQVYPLVKPRKGRGAAGIAITSNPIDMSGMISQEEIKGEEYTVDVFCDKNSHPVYIVPRKRLRVRDGKSTAGLVVNHHEIIQWVQKICEAAHFLGPINIQCFVNGKGIRFTEVNSRIAGGMALGFAATENWINLIVEHFIDNKTIDPKPVQYGMRMLRYYAEIFVPNR